MYICQTVCTTSCTVLTVPKHIVCEVRGDSSCHLALPPSSLARFLAVQHQADYGDIIKTAITHCLRYSVAQSSYEWSHVLVEALKSEYHQLTEEQDDEATVDFTSASWGDLKVLTDCTCLYMLHVMYSTLCIAIWVACLLQRVYTYVSTGWPWFHFSTCSSFHRSSEYHIVCVIRLFNAKGLSDFTF